MDWWKAFVHAPAELDRRGPFKTPAPVRDPIDIVFVVALLHAVFIEVAAAYVTREFIVQCIGFRSLEPETQAQKNRLKHGRFFSSSSDATP